MMPKFDTLNFNDFYKDTATGLLFLARLFPVKSDLYIQDIIGCEQTDEYGLHSKRYLSALGALIWLIDEDYIRCRSIHREENLEHAVITQTTFLQLWSPAPKSLVQSSQDAQNISNQTHEENSEDANYLQLLYLALKSDNSETLTQVMLSFFKDSEKRR